MYAQLSNQNLRIHFLDAFFQVMIFLKQQFQCPILITVAILFNGTLQPLYVIVQTETNVAQSPLIAPLSVILRPELTLLELGQIQRQFFYWIPLLVVCFKSLSMLFLVLLFKSKKRNLQSFESQFVIQIMAQFTSFYQQFLGTLLIVPFTTLCLLSLQDFFEDVQNHDDSKYIHIILSILALMLIQADALMYLTVTEKSITYKFFGVDKLRTTFIDFTTYFIRMATIVLFVGFQPTNAITHMQHILLTFYSLLSLYNQYMHRSYVLKYQYTTFYAGQTFVIVASSVSYISFLLQDQHLFLSLTLILYPLVLQSLLGLHQRDQERSFQFLFKPSDKHIDELVYQLIRLLNNCYFGLHHKLVTQSLIYRSCTKIPNCSVPETNFVTDTHQANPITRQMEKCFIFSLLQAVKRYYLIYKSRSFRQKQYLLYSYLVLLYSFGWYQLAVKNLSFLIYRHSKNANKKDDYLYQMTSHNSSYENQDKQLILVEESDYVQIKLSLYQRNKFIYLLKRSKLHMKNKFGSSLQAAQQNQLSTYITYYLLNEFNLNQSYYRIMQLIRQKTEFLSQLIYKFDYRAYRKLALELNKLDNDLKLYYQECPSLRFQKMLCFYEAEILNNFYTSYRYQKSLADENLFGFDSIDQLGYAFISVNEDLNNLTIEQYSIKFGEIHGRKTNTEKLKFNQILPKIFIQEHNNMIETFLTSGKSLYYRNFNPNYMRLTNGLIKSISTCFDNTTLITQDKLLFVALIQENRNLVNFFLVDSCYRTGGFSLGFLERLGYESNHILELAEKYEFDEIQVDLILPTFEHLIAEGYLEKKVVNQELFFINLNKLPTTDNPIKMQQLITENEFRGRRLMQYQCDIAIKSKIINRYIYYLVEFENIYPQEGSSQNYIVSINNEEMEPQQVHVFDVKSRKKYDFEETRIWNSQQLIGSMDKSLERSFEKFSPNNNNFLTSRQGSIRNLENQIKDNEANQEKSLLQSLKQQEFFNNYEIEDVKSHLNQAEFNEMIHAQQRVLKSAYSSQSFRASQMFYKAVLIQKVLQNKTPIGLLNLQLILLLNFVVMITFTGIVLEQLPNDQLQFIEEIDMISLHASVMGPHDLFFSMRVTITNYQLLVQEGFLDQALEIELTSPYFEHLKFGYQEFRNGIFKQLSNPYVKEHLNIEVSDVYFMDQNASVLQSYRVSLREQIMMMANQQYELMNMYQSRINASFSSPQVFDYANYFNLHRSLHKLTHSLHDSSKARSSAVNTKWTILSIVFILLEVLLAAFTYLRAHAFLGFYDRFLMIFNFVNVHTLVVETDRLRNILKQIELNHHFIYQYYFDVEAKDNQHESESKKYQKYRNVQKQKVYFKHYSRVPIFTIILLMALLFFGYCMAINRIADNYLSRYAETTNLYKLIQDMKVSSGSIVLYKELLLRIDAFSFLNETHRSQLYDLIDDSHRAIKEYVEKSATLMEADYLVDSQFIQFFNEIKGNNLCDYIEDEFADFMAFYCDIAFEGALQKGVVSGLNYMVNLVKTEQALNNFTQRIETALYEFEGSQIITRVFFNLSSVFQAGLVHITKDQNDLAYKLSVTFMVIVLSCSVSLFTFLHLYLSEEYQIVKRIVSIIPYNLIHHEESLERYIKQSAMQQRLL